MFPLFAQKETIQRKLDLRYTLAGTSGVKACT